MSRNRQALGEHKVRVWRVLWEPEGVADTGGSAKSVVGGSTRSSTPVCLERAVAGE